MVRFFGQARVVGIQHAVAVPPPSNTAASIAAGELQMRETFTRIMWQNFFVFMVLMYQKKVVKRVSQKSARCHAEKQATRGPPIQARSFVPPTGEQLHYAGPHRFEKQPS